MSLSRKLHWAEQHFHAFLLEREGKPFAWGSNDCASFAADGILAITGTDIMTDFRGYGNPDEAYRKVRAVTGAVTLPAVVDWCARRNGMMERRFPLMAQRGDLVLYEEGGRLCAGLVHLNGRDVVSPGEKGLLRSPLTAVRRSWGY